MSRFSLSPARRGALPLFIGLCGPSGSGKTYSALRLATGIQKVAGGELAVIDTEANRALHYADAFKFQHMPFAPPFSPDDYWEAIEECIKRGAKTVVIDSMSHEHEGPGGVLEWHEAEAQRLAKAWNQQPSAVQFPAWAKPKAARRRLLNNILQVDVNLICCFRAKRKVEMPKNGGKKQPVDMGWMPIAGNEYAYEMTALGVLPPGSKGIPDWNCPDPGTEMVVKRPAQFEGILKSGQQLSESMGEAMAKWAKGSPCAGELSAAAKKLRDAIKSADSTGELEQVVEDIKSEQFNGNVTDGEVGILRNFYAVRLKEVEEAA